MRLSHEGVIVIALIIEFSGVLVSAEGAFSSATNVGRYAIKSSDVPLKTPTGTLNSPPEPVALPPSDSLTSQTDPLKSPPVSLKLANRKSGCSACQQQSETAGDILTCHIISGIFTKDRLSVGSHVVTTIPQHACKINVTGTAIAYGHLVLTTSSGDHILTGRQRQTSMHRRAAGTDFFFHVKPPPPPADGNKEHHLSPTQYILSDGPLDQSVDVRVVKELELGSTEILYTYTIPKRNETIVTYHRARHHRNPRSTPLLKRYNSVPIRSSRKSSIPSETSTSSKIVSHEIDTTAKMDKTSAVKSREDAQLQDDPSHRIQTGSDGLGPGRVLGNRKLIQNWNQYLARGPDQHPNGRFYQSAPQVYYDPRRNVPEVYGSPASQPLYAPRYHVPLSHYQGPPRTFPRPNEDFRTPQAGFKTPEVSLSQEDMGFDKPLERFNKPETQFSQPEADSTQPEVSEEDQNDYDLQAETGYRDHLPMSAYHGGAPQRPRFNPRTQQQLPASYLESQGQNYAFYSAGPKSDLLEIPIYQRRESSDPGIAYHAQFYRNPFSPDIDGHSLMVYGPQPRWPHQPQPPLMQQEGYFPPRRPDVSAAAESRYVHQPPPPALAPAQPLTAGFIRPDLVQNRRLEAADDVGGYDDGDEDDSYGWKIAGFTNCSRTCGGGVQSTMVVCVKMGTTPVRVTDENCGDVPKPTTTNVTCNNRPCQPSWEASDWSPCSTSCNLGQQVRHVECRQRISAAAAVTVTATRCQHEARPEVQRDCNADRRCYVWKTKEWSECSSVCGRGRRTREVTCTASDGRSVHESRCEEGGMNSRPETVKDCQMEACSKSWYHSRWPTQCSSDCGDSLHSRRVHCGADDNKCNEKTKPPTTKECRSEVPCGGTWFVSSWTRCSVSCGEGVRRRDVVCVKKLDKLTVIVSDENCIEEDRVEEEEACSEGPCPPTWFITDWSECSRTCNTGVQTREAKCLDDEERQSQLCDPLDKPELKQTCNTNPCAQRLNRNNAQQLVVSCRDQLKTCQIVVQARLCRYNFYKESCCFSCSSRGYGDDSVTSQTTIKS